MKKLPKGFLHGADYNPDQWLAYPEILAEDHRLMPLAQPRVMSIGHCAWRALGAGRVGAVAAVGGMQAFKDLWEDARFGAIRRAYERLMERVPAVRPLVLGGEGKEKGQAREVAAT